MYSSVTIWSSADDSYDAAEDNELSFKEGDKITEIDKVDEDWWQGKANGATGLFPGKLKLPYMF